MDTNEIYDILKKIGSKYQKPILIYHWPSIERNIDTITNELAPYNVDFAFPVKAFPVEKFISKVARMGIGFDVSCKREYELIRNHCPESSIVSYSGVVECDFDHAHNVICYSNLYGNNGSFNNSYRININRTGLTFSHFGVADWNGNLKLNHAEHIHIHISDSNRSEKSFFTMICETISDIAHSFPALKSLNIGGGWDKMKFTDFLILIQEIRLIFGSEIKIIAEPGNMFFDNSGYLLAAVLGINVINGKTIVYIDSCREAHTKWSNPQLVPLTPANLNRSNSSLVICGCSCDEKDIFGLYKTDFCPKAGDFLLFSKITPYSYAWNTSFNGIEKAEFLLYGL